MVTSFFSRFRRTLEELFNSKGDSIVRYRGRDGKVHYIASSEDPDVEPWGGDIDLKTINDESLKGTGNISITTDVPVVEVTGATPSQQLAPNTYYKFGEIDGFTSLTMGTPISGILNIYSYSFTASSSFDASTSTYLPEGVTLSGEFAIEEGQTCEISIQDGRAAFMVWDAPEAEG